MPTIHARSYGLSRLPRAGLRQGHRDRCRCVTGPGDIDIQAALFAKRRFVVTDFEHPRPATCGFTEVSRQAA